MSTSKIVGRLLAMSQEEIMGTISPRTIRDIKREDPNPRLLAFVVGQEGEARPVFASLGQVLTRWYRSAIDAVTSMLELGAPAWHRHGEPANGSARQAIGEVVGKLTKVINGAASTIAVFYVYPQFRDIPLDVASIEAQVVHPPDSKEFDVEAADIKAITGVALSSSQIDNPAFPGATLLGQLVAFAENSRQGGETHMTLEEVRKAIQEGKYLPGDIFSVQQLTSDPSIKEHVEEKVNNAKGYDIRKRQALETENETLKKENETLKTETTAAKVGTLKIKARETLDAVLAERPALKGDEKFLKYVRQQFEKRFTPGADEAKLKGELNTFADTIKGEYAEVFGEPGVSGDTKPNGKPKPGEKPADKKADDKASDLPDPKENDLMPDLG